MADGEPGTLLAFPQAAEAIELRHLRAFVAVAEELHFSRAADRLHLSQSALSRQIRALEQLLGCELLRRSTRRVELTLAGEALLDRTRSLLDDVDQAVAATQMLGGELAVRLTEVWAPVFATATPGISIEDRRNAIEGLCAQFPPPPEVAVEPVNAGGVPSFRMTAKPEAAPGVFYLHGGAHVLGSTYGYRGLIGALAAASGASALGPEYRLAPEHPFPADVDDAERAYRWLVDSGVDARRLVVAGDSSGCALVMSLLHRLKESGGPLPGGVLLFCPWVDPTGRTLEISKADDANLDPMRELAMSGIAQYIGDHHVEDPRLNALEADLGGLPPMLIQAATGDPVREDAHLLAERAREHGVDVTLELYPVETHGFQTFWSFLPEAKEAVERAGEFVNRTGAEGWGTQAG